MMDDKTRFCQGPHHETWRDLAQRAAASCAASVPSTPSDQEGPSSESDLYLCPIRVQQLEVSDEPFGPPITGLAETPLTAPTVRFLVAEPLSTRFVRLDQIEGVPRPKSVLVDVSDCHEVRPLVFRAQGTNLDSASGETDEEGTRDDAGGETQQDGR